MFQAKKARTLIPHFLQFLQVQNGDLAAFEVDEFFVFEIGKGADHGFFGSAYDAGQVLARNADLGWFLPVLRLRIVSPPKAGLRQRACAPNCKPVSAGVLPGRPGCRTGS